MARPSLDSVRIAVRTLAKQPGFTTVVVLSLALAIAINTTMYSVLDALIKPRVDIRSPEDVFVIRMYGDYKHRVSREQRDALLRSGLKNVVAVAWVDAIGAYTRQTLEAGANYTEGRVKAVSPEYFPLIGPKLLAGRLFNDSDVSATPRPIVIGEKTAAALFPDGANPVGSRVSIGDSTYAVIGVVSRYSDFPDWRADAWVLGAPRAMEMLARVIRLKPGASAQDADRELSLVATQIALAAGEDPRYVAFRFFRPAEPQFHANRMHIAIGMAVISVLLVACANLANMQLARGIGRRRELALRNALGASRSQIIRHLLTESVLLASAGLALGIVLTLWGASILRASIPPAVGSFIVEPQLSWRVFVFALAATVACVLLVGLAPAIRVSRVDPNEMLKSGAGTGATRTHRRQYGYLVAAEIGLALGLLSAATVLVRASLYVSDERNYDPMPLIAGSIRHLSPTTPQRVPTSALLQTTVARVAQVDGVVAASARMGAGIDGLGVTVSDSARGVREIPAPGWGYSIVSPSYLRTFGIPIVRGRDFLDGERDEPAVIIDEYTAAGLWPGGNPIGALIKFGDAKSKAPYVRIVGVAGLMAKRRGGLASTTEMRLASMYYLPGRGDSVTIKPNYITSVYFTARAPVNTEATVIRLRRMGAQNVAGFGEEERRAQQGIDFIATMFSLFAALGLGLAAFGVYGVVAHSVAERRRELGVRIALGATARDIIHAVLRESVVIALAGIAIGLLITKYGVRLLPSVDIYNAPLFAGVALFLFGVAAMSAYVPARRATKVDPTESLRCD